MFHTMRDAAGIVLRVHYKSMKCDVLFSQGSVRTLFRRGGHFYRCMECRHGLAMGILSLRLSVRPSVRPSVKRVDCDKTEESCI